MFDRLFIMDHKYKSLLLNVPTRHVIVKIDPPVSNVKKQLEKLRALDIVNFFILGSQKTISHALEAAQSLNYTGRKFAWYTISLEVDRPKCESCHNMSMLSFTPHLEKRLKSEETKKLTQDGVLAEPVLVSSFYYEIADMAVIAMKSAMESNLWDPTRSRFTCDTPESTKSPNQLNSTKIVMDFDLLSVLQNVTDSSKFSSLFDYYSWGKGNGHYYPTFEMDLKLVEISQKGTNSELVGNWTVGTSNPLMVIFLFKKIMTNQFFVKEVFIAI